MLHPTIYSEDMSTHEAGQLVRQALSRGWTRERYTGSGHIMLRWRTGHKLVVPSTPHMGKRSLQNATAMMRRIERTEEQEGGGAA